MKLQLSQTIDGIALRAECDAALRAQCEALLAALDRGDRLRPGQTVGFGPIELVLVAEGDALRLQVAAETVHVAAARDLSPALALLAAQAALLRQVGVPPGPLRARQLVVAARGVLAAREVFALRAAAQDDDDSGWSLSRVDDAAATSAADDPEAFEALEVHTVSVERPVLATVLALPVGWSARVDGDAVVAVYDEHGAQRSLG